MNAHGIENVEVSEGSSVTLGACLSAGVRKTGACVAFSLYAPTADKVWLVGSFNDWNESHPMKREENGMWHIMVGKNEMPYGTAYKYKLYFGDEAEYIPDPYAVETDGVPYHNSVYRDTSGKKQSHCKKSSMPITPSTPLNIYKLRLDRWICNKNGLAPDYVSLARELLPYVLQMGYTHIAISGMTERYYDLGKTELTEASFVVRSGQGGADFLVNFAETIRSAGIGLLIELDFDNTFFDGGFDLQFYTDNVAYWLDLCSADGILIDRRCGRDKEFFTRLVHNIKIKRAGACVVAVKGDGVKTDFADIEVKCPARDISYLNGAGDTETSLSVRAALMACLLLGEGRMLTRMGDELAQPFDAGERFFRELENEEPRARFQLLCSELNNIYAGSPCFGKASEASYAEDLSNGCMIIKKCGEKEKYIVIADMSGMAAKIAVGEGDWHLLLDSRRILGLREVASFDIKNRETVVQLPAYGVVVLKNIQNINHFEEEMFSCLRKKNA